MNEFRFSSARAAETNVGTSRLERFIVRARRDFPESVLRWQPHLDVVGLSIAEAQIPRGKCHHAIMNSEKLQDPLGVTRERLKLIIGILRQRIFNYFHLFKLMLPNDATCIFAVAAGL